MREEVSHQSFYLNVGLLVKIMLVYISISLFLHMLSSVFLTQNYSPEIENQTLLLVFGAFAKSL